MDGLPRTVNGTVRAVDVLMVDSIPEVRDATVRDIAGFAHKESSERC